MNERQQQLLFDYLGSHLVALCGVFSPTGRPGEVRAFAASACVIALDGRFFVVTAGHVLAGIERHLAGGRVLEHCNLADFFGRDARTDIPTPIDYGSLRKFHVDDDSQGLDIGVLELPEFYVHGLRSNGMMPISEAHWLEGDLTDAQNFLVIGFPEHEIEMDADGVAGHVRPCLAGLTPAPLPPEKVGTTHPLFCASINSTEPASMVGFSGGPIFRLRAETSGERAGGLTCWLHAIQAFWHKSTRLVFGCPMSVVAEQIRQRLPPA